MSSIILPTRFELLILMVLLWAGVRKPKLGDPVFRCLSYSLGWLARRPRWAVAFIGLTSLVMSAALALLGRMPQPAVHDEFSYLLAADTFAHGRLTNPPHPMWVHFESFHIIHQPTYQSKYPPAQGLMLAAGQVIGGHPIVGVWLSAALACAVIVWMLLAWLPPRWAILGGLLALLHPTTVGWSQCYWGGMVPLIGGALMLGAWRRLVPRPCVRSALLLGLGIAVLVNSRPYEGMVFTLLLLTGLLIWMLHRTGPPVRVSLSRIVLPILAVLVPVALAMGYYNWRVTGDPLRLPYVVHEATYSATPLFLWQNPRTVPAYRHKELRKFHRGWEFQFYDPQSPNADLASRLRHKIAVMANGSLRLFVPTTHGAENPADVGFHHKYLQFVPGVLLIVIPWLLRKERWLRRELLIYGLFLMALLPITWMQAHYAAPVSGLLFLILIQAIRHLRLWRWRGRPIGRFAARALLVSYVASFVVMCLHLSWMDSEPWRAQMLHRAHILEQLKRTGDRHLVVVVYGPKHSALAEWVYNDAAIDAAAVVWARAMGPMRDRELLDYFKDRQVWLVEVDQAKELPRLKPYPQEPRLNFSTQN